MHPFATIITAATVLAMSTLGTTPGAAARTAIPIGIAGDPGCHVCAPAPCPPTPFVRPDPGISGPPFDGWDCPLINRPRCCGTDSPP